MVDIILHMKKMCVLLNTCNKTCINVCTSVVTGWLEWKMLLRTVIKHGQTEGFIRKEVVTAAVLFIGWTAAKHPIVGATLTGILSCFILLMEHVALQT